MSPRLSPFAFLRLDGATVERIRREQGLGDLALTALLTIALGAGAYGVAFGLWRAPEQAAFGAIKLPCVFVGVALLTAASSAVLAPLLGARLRPLQSIVAILASLAVTASILGALAPVAIVFVLASSPLEAPNHAAVAQSLVLAHTLVIAVAGTAGVLALLRLVARLVPSRPIARRVVLAWMATQLLTGAQLSWLLRPFLGRPDRPVTFFSPDALEGGFFDEVLRLSEARFGVLSPFVLGWLALMLLFWIGVALTSDRPRVSVVVWPRGLEVIAAEAETHLVPWCDIVGASTLDTRVIVHLVRDEALVLRTLEVPCRSLTDARELCRTIERARTAAQSGPYREAASA